MAGEAELSNEDKARDYVRKRYRVDPDKPAWRGLVMACLDDLNNFGVIREVEKQPDPLSQSTKGET